MMQTAYETKRLLLLQSHPRLKKQVFAYYQENHDFLQPTEPKHTESFLTLETQKLLLKRDWKNFKKQTHLRLWMMLKENPNRIIGVVTLSNITPMPVQSATVSYKCHKDELNKGYITEALEKLISIAFDDIGLHRLEVSIMPRNRCSLHVAQKLGFQNEGIEKECVQINGKWEDHVRMARINPNSH